jgi:hypothetical protein
MAIDPPSVQPVEVVTDERGRARQWLSTVKAAVIDQAVRRGLRVARG